MSGETELQPEKTLLQGGGERGEKTTKTLLGLVVTSWTIVLARPDRHSGKAFLEEAAWTGPGESSDTFNPPSEHGSSEKRRRLGMKIKKRLWTLDPEVKGL